MDSLGTWNSFGLMSAAKLPRPMPARSKAAGELTSVKADCRHPRDCPGVTKLDNRITISC